VNSFDAPSGTLLAGSTQGSPTPILIVSASNPPPAILVFEVLIVVLNTFAVIAVVGLWRGVRGASDGREVSHRAGSLTI
jgi:hypothetical protein